MIQLYRGVLWPKSLTWQAVAKIERSEKFMDLRGRAFMHDDWNAENGTMYDGRFLVLCVIWLCVYNRLCMHTLFCCGLRLNSPWEYGSA